MVHRKNWSIPSGLTTAIVCVLVMTAISGCVTPQPDTIPAFRQGVVMASQQTGAAFADINEMLRTQQLDRAVQQPAINEDLFAEGIPADARATWMRAFRLMDEYAAALERLLAPEQREEVEAQLRLFGEKISTVSEAPLPEGVSGGFVKLGGVLLQIKSGQDALKSMREVDPAIQDIFAAMADAVGSSNAEGLRLTVRSSWTTELARIQVAFARAADSAAKRRAAEAYLKMLGDRDAHDQLLNALRISFLSLGSAHAAMARGDRLNASGFIAIVRDEYNGLKEEIDRLREKRNQR
jgi:hypothetical protein